MGFQTLNEKQILKKVNKDELMEFTKEISKEYRITGSDEERRSLEYIRGLLDSYGYKTEILEYPGYISFPRPGFIAVEGEEEKTFRAIGHCFTPSTPIGGIVGEAVSEHGNDWSGKIVIFTALGGTDKIKKAQERKAKGVVFIHDENIHYRPASDIWGTPTYETVELLPKIPVTSIDREAGDFILQQMEKGKVTLRFESIIISEWRNCPILTADIPSGKNNKFVLFTGHIDSWELGAMDNGSANAAMVECAKLLAGVKEDLERGIRIIFWSGHSQGKYAGSTWYADTHFEELEEKCVAYVNIDSVGGKGAIVVEEAPAMIQAKKLVAEVIKNETGTEYLGKRMARNADQSFFGVGLTSIFGTFSEQDKSRVNTEYTFTNGKGGRAGGLGWWWHTTHDTIDKLDPEIFARDTRIYLSLLYRLLTFPVLPFYVEPAVEELIRALEKLNDKLAGKFDLTTLEVRLRELKSRAQKFDEITAGLLTGGSKENIESIEEHAEKQQSVFRELVRISYHEKEAYFFDLCGSIYPIPNLAAGEKLAVSLEDSGSYYMYLTEFRRGYNRVNAYVKRLLGLTGGEDVSI